MKKRLLVFALLLLTLLIFPACEFKNTQSIKAITKPYITQYECTSATYGEEDLLEKYEYFKIVLVDKSELNVIYKLKGGNKQTVKGTYTLEPDTRVLTADIGILGYNIRQKTIVKDGKFTISKTIGSKQLILNFENK